MTSWKKYLNQLWSLVKGMIPTKFFLLLIGFGILVVSLGAVLKWGWLFFIVYNGLLGILILIEIFSFKRFPPLKVSREFETLFELQEKNEVTIHIYSEKPLSTEMWLQDDYPQGFWVDKRTFHLVWTGEEKQSVSYFAQPHRRGRHSFHQIHLRIMSKFRLFLFQISQSHSEEVHVYPSLESTRKVRKGVYHKQSEGDTFVARSFGTGREFSHLREYVTDDEARNINWLATARTGKLVSNVFQPEVGQQVAILLDCGRLMGVQDDGRSRLDISLEAVLGFAAVALQRGDRVSFLAFSNQVIRWVPLDMGMKHLRKIIEACYDLEPSYIETDYLCAWEHLAKTHKQKTLIALFTDMSNLSFSETIDQMIRLTQKKHLMLAVSLQDAQFMDRLQRIPKDEKEIYEQLVMETLMEERKVTQRKWGTYHFVSLDVSPDQIASAVIYKYLEIKNHQSLKRIF